MKITITHLMEDEIELLDTFNRSELDLFDYSVVMTTDEESTSTDAVRMLVKALEIEGYQVESIINSLIGVAYAVANANGIAIEDCDE